MWVLVNVLNGEGFAVDRSLVPLSSLLFSARLQLHPQGRRAGEQQYDDLDSRTDLRLRNEDAASPTNSYTNLGAHIVRLKKRSWIDEDSLSVELNLLFSYCMSTHQNCQQAHPAPSSLAPGCPPLPPPVEQDNGSCRAVTDAIRMALQVERRLRVPPSIPPTSSGSSTTEREIEMTAQRDNGTISAYLAIWAYYVAIRQNRWAVTGVVRMTLQVERRLRAPPSIPPTSSVSSTMEHGIEMTAQCDNSRGLEPPPRLDMSLKVSNFFTKAKESNISDREAIAIMGTIDLTAAAVSFGCMGVKFNEEDHGDSNPAPHVLITLVHKAPSPLAPACPPLPPPVEQDNVLLVTLKNLGINFANYFAGAISTCLAIWAYYVAIRQNRWVVTGTVRMALQVERRSRASLSILPTSSGSSTTEREIEMTAQHDNGKGLEPPPPCLLVAWDSNSMMRIMEAPEPTVASPFEDCIAMEL
ncbi:hypothetical protein [Oryza sativa Japonica Group]|uniref:Uncharacterized protein n=1 Tax=Oryza sativa subsp. japonica TaxID=39947 RepID=Q5ZDL9_ORYSJ|nr:hypothetical protein [Oryza sativa Japonica Group]BAD61264.1 hypothetical protein [Oryza sativa Japonica Group]